MNFFKLSKISKKFSNTFTEKNLRTHGPVQVKLMPHRSQQWALLSAQAHTAKARVTATPPHPTARPRRR